LTATHTDSPATGIMPKTGMWAERMFANRMNATTLEVPSGHLAMVSHPGQVVSLTETAAEAAPAVDVVT
jgi:hypothetical protein